MVKPSATRRAYAAAAGVSATRIARSACYRRLNDARIARRRCQLQRDRQPAARGSAICPMRRKQLAAIGPLRPQDVLEIGQRRGERADRRRENSPRCRATRARGEPAHALEDVRRDVVVRRQVPKKCETTPSTKAAGREPLAWPIAAPVATWSDSIIAAPYPHGMARTEAQRRRLTLVATILGSSLAFIDVTVVIIALPRIETDLDLGLTGSSGSTSSFSLALAALYLVGGAIGDRYGPRGCSWLPWPASTRVAARGGGADGGVLIGAHAPGHRRRVRDHEQPGAAPRDLREGGRAGRRPLDVVTGVVTIAGPPVGGALVEWASWRWISCSTCPLRRRRSGSRARGAAASRNGPASAGSTSRAPCSIAVGTSSLTFALVEGADKGFAQDWWLFLVAGLSLIAFLVVEHRTAEPDAAARVFRIRNSPPRTRRRSSSTRRSAPGSSTSPCSSSSSAISPFVASLILAPTTVVMILLAPRFGALSDRQGPRLYLTVGPSLLGCAALLFMAVDEKEKVWYIGIPALGIFSLGLAMLVAPITATALKSAPERYAGIASGIDTTFSRIGNLLAVAIVGLVVTVVFEANGAAPPMCRSRRTRPGLRSATPRSTPGGPAWRWSPTLAFAGAAVSAIFISNREARAGAEEEAEAEAMPGEPAPAKS